MITILVCVILLIIWAKLKLTHQREFHEKIKNFPGTNRTLPIVGDLHLSFGKSMNDKIKVLMNISNAAGCTIKMWLGYKLIMVVNDPDDARAVLTSAHCLNKASIYHMAIGGNGIVIAKGQKWKNQRRHLNSTFNLKLIHSHEAKYKEYAKQLIYSLEDLAKTGEEFDLANVVGTHVTDIIIRTMYGSLDHHIQLSEQCFVEIKNLMYAWGQRTLKMSSTLLLFAIQKLFHISSRESELIRKLRSLIEPIRAKREEEYLTNGPRYEITDNGDVKNLNSESFIEKLTRLRYEGTFTYHEYRHNTLTLFLAGSDTSATNIANVILMLALHPTHQEGVYEEICRVVGDANSNIELNLENLSELHYLDRVIKETLRLCPIIPFIGRIAERDIQLSNGTVPAGTDIFISLINLHTNPNIWGPNADQFNPDHFLDENVEKRQRGTYIPFSYGPRNCIGKKFAQLTTSMAVVHLLRNYKFTTKLKFDELDFGFALSTYLFNGHLVSIEKR